MSTPYNYTTNRMRSSITRNSIKPAEHLAYPTIGQFVVFVFQWLETL